MIVVIRYGDGGYDPSVAGGNAVDWADTGTRKRCQVVAGKQVWRDFNPSETAVADAMERSGKAEDAADTIRQGLADGIAALTAAQAAAQADIVTATTLKAQADTIAAKAVPALSDITAIAQMVSQQAVWRATVDQNNVTVDGALLNLARLAAGLT